MHVIKRPNGFDLDENLVLDQQVGYELPDDNAVIINADSPLLNDGQTCLAEIVDQGIFVDLLDEAGPKRPADRERATDDSLRCRLQP